MNDEHQADVEHTNGTENEGTGSESNAWSKSEVAGSIVNRHAILSAGTAIIPLPIGDTAALLGVQLNMIKRVAEVYEDTFSQALGRNVVLGLIGSSLPFTLRYTGASLLKAVPFIGQTASTLTMPALNSAFTYALGQVMIRHYESGGTLLNFDAQRTQAYFREKLHEGSAATA